MRSALLLAPLFAIGCANAPAWPEQDGGKALRERGVAEATIQKVVAGEPLELAQYEEFGRMHDHNVAFLLARNPSLPVERMERYAEASDDFIRS